MLEQEEQHLVVALIDLARVCARYSFRSVRTMIRAQPSPPSGRGLRRGGSVNCAFALPRPAPSRRLRADEQHRLSGFISGEAFIDHLNDRQGDAVLV